MGLTPFFRGEGIVRVAPTRFVEREADSSFEGALHAWADLDESESDGGAHPFVFDVANIALPGRRILAAVGGAQIAAFASEWTAVIRLARLAFLFTLVCGLAGCGSFQAYPGAARQERDIAIVNIDYLQAFWILGGASLTFRSLDGVSIPLSNSDGGLITEVQLEQGTHDIAFDYKACMYGAYAMNLCGPVKTETLRFTALRGHRYHLNADVRDDRLWGWIVDVETDQIVAGASPP